MTRRLSTQCWRLTSMSSKSLVIINFIPFFKVAFHHRVRWALLQEEKQLLSDLEKKAGLSTTTYREILFQSALHCCMFSDEAKDVRLGEIYEQLSQIGAASAESKARRILFGLGFDRYSVCTDLFGHIFFTWHSNVYCTTEKCRSVLLSTSLEAGECVYLWLGLYSSSRHCWLWFFLLIIGARCKRDFDM